MKFEDLSPEGRMQKIRSHVEGNLRVPGDWGQWLLDVGYGDGIEPVNGTDFPAFPVLSAGERISRIREFIARRDYLPSTWVEWLLDQEPRAPRSNPFR